ncbi:MAG: arginine--tRNA ligase [Candidatus Krumholzibacteria bacterium]|nr:arginine--tRNA ligase [Candidatus Krumholzibacteria bacterium]
MTNDRDTARDNAPRDASSASERSRSALASALAELGLAIDREAIQIERPADTAHGDLSSNVALIAAKQLKRDPRELAAEIAARVKTDADFVDRVEVAGPGFINFAFSRKYIAEQVKEIVRLGASYGDGDLGRGRKVQVEFVSANPTGPLVIVSARAAAIGAALVKILRKAGYDVQAEYYVNDAGSQVAKLGLSLLARFRQRLGEDVPFPEEGYPGEYLVEIAREIPEDDGRAWLALPQDTAVTAFGQAALEKIMHMIQSDLELFGVRYDNFFRESGLYADNEIWRTLDLLKERGVVYGEDGAQWFRSAELGDEKDRVLVRSDGSPTYFLADAAYHLNKLRRGFTQAIDLWGPDHHGHIKRMQSVSRVLGAPADWPEVLIVQWVRLVEEGKVVSMSKRGGEFVTLRDLVEDVGADAAKFFFLMRKTSAHLDFNLTLARKESDENPVYYVQYAHARISSVVAYAREQGVDFPADTSCVELLTEAEEIELMRKLVIFPELIRGAALTREPHFLTAYAQQLAAEFHRFYHVCRIVSSNRRLSEARLLLAEATRVVLAESLRVLGVSAPEKM